jgi:hypothetical protein
VEVGVRIIELCAARLVCSLSPVTDFPVWAVALFPWPEDEEGEACAAVAGARRFESEAIFLPVAVVLALALRSDALPVLPLLLAGFVGRLLALAL